MSPAGGRTCSSAESAAARLKGDPLAVAAVSGISSAALPRAFSDPAATPGPTNPSEAPPGVSFGVEGQGSRQALWRNLARTLGDGSCTMGQLGEKLVLLVRQSPTYLGSVLNDILDGAITRGRSLEGEGVVPKELLPLPMVELSADDMKDLYSSHEQAKFGEFAKQWHGSQREVAGRLRGAVAWVAVMVAGLNFMHAGANNKNPHPHPLGGARQLSTDGGHQSSLPGC